MSLKISLLERRAQLYKRWLDRALAAYPADAATFLQREKDRFANPVGQTLAEELGVLLDLLLGEGGSGTSEHPSAEAYALPLAKIIKIRAIQEMRASQALAFLFELKGVIREMLQEKPVSAGDVSAELADLVSLEAEIDQIALLGFDLFADNLTQLSQIRIDEIKRSVSGLMRRLNRSAEAAEPTSTDPEECT